MTNSETFKTRLAEAITQSGLTKKQIARELNICRQIISSYINGKKQPSLETFANLCKILDVDANYILGINDKIQ